ncbi:hypothetical protein F0L17_01295 [Streptomyces sp. TRM43335]|uniref:Asp23/Gls24 family envelope stress response protein n=1 Tax=Streptomyces taklimakanensis TaxID=2569853 RepID=A0A6G2B6U2_9ACTN|nr:hypothetical protein [Streptomyces taklimakanensis]
MPPGERGATRIADRVFSKIASRAAREALDTAPDTPRQSSGRGADPKVAITVRRPPDRDGTNGEARVRVIVDLPYPCDIGARCGAVRARVSSRLWELAGLRARQVTVEVRRLHVGTSDGRRVTR